MVFIRDVSGNADAGTAQKWGGNQISLIDNLFDNVDISASIVNGTGKVRMATAWYFRSGKLELRNPADTFSYIFIGSAITANRNITIPLITGNANMVLDSFSNIFLATQSIQVNSNDPFSLYKPINTNLTTWDLNWDANDSAGNRDTYVDARAMIIDNTSGSEDGRFSINVLIGGTKREVFRLQDNNCTIYNAQSNAVGTNTQLEFLGLDSGSTEHVYAMIRSEIVDNTGGSEDGKLEFLTSSGGTPSEAFLIHSNGDIDIERGCLDIKADGLADILDLERTDNGTGTENRINFWLEDSTAALHTYGRIHAEITDNANGSEDGDIVISASSNGTLSEIANFVGNEKLFRTVADVYDQIEIYRPNNVINDQEAGLKLSKNSSTGVRRGVVWLYGGLEDNTNAAEFSYFNMWLLNAGTSVKTMRVGPRGGLSLGPDGNNLGHVSRVVTKSGTPVNFNNTSAEQTLFTQNILADTMGANGMLHLILLGSFRQNQATGTTYTLRCKFGGTTWWEGSAGTLAQDADYLVWRLDIIIANQNNTSSQICHGTFTMNTAEAATVGWGLISDDEIQAYGTIVGSTSKTTASTNNSIAVTGQMSVANAATEMNVDYKFLEINPSVS